MSDDPTVPPPPMRTVWLITGLPGAGKSTVSRRLAQTYPRAAHLDGDHLQGAVVSGVVWPNEAPAAEADRQYVLAVRHQCLLARSFAAAGFVPVVDYAVWRRPVLARYRRALRRLDLHLVVLDPGPEVARRRDEARPQPTVGAPGEALQAVLTTELTGIGLWIDTSDLTAEQTVAAILRDQHWARLAPRPAPIRPVRPGGSSEPPRRPSPPARPVIQAGEADARR